jgi:hypothetical protein
MTPLSTSAVVLPATTTTRYKAALAAGDQLAIKVPDTPQGTLRVTVTNDLGEPVGQQTLSPDSTKYLVAQRTGTYQIELTWTPTVTGSTNTVNFEHLPGPLNGLMEMLTSYTENVSDSRTPILYAYGDADMAGVNAAEGTAAAPYWPLWSDASYFPIPEDAGPETVTWASQLNAAYLNLVAHRGTRHCPTSPTLSTRTLPLRSATRGSSTTWIRPTGRPTIKKTLLRCRRTSPRSPSSCPRARRRRTLSTDSCTTPTSCGRRSTMSCSAARPT